jgi:cysteine desulfurase
MLSQIFLDYNSTTPVDSRLLEEMLPYFSDRFGNAASTTHLYGVMAKKAVSKAREIIADFLGCEPNEIYFTSGSTEAINFVIKGIFENYTTKGKHIITCKTEHKAVLDVCTHLVTKNRAEVTYLDVDREGNLDLNELRDSIRDDTVMVSVMHGNNETGVIHPVEKIAEICRSRNVIFFSDITQTAGKLRLEVSEMGFDALCFSAHKMYGPKGVGVVMLRRKDPRVVPATLLHGGGHESGFRSGTLNVPGIVGLAKACEIASSEMWDDNMRISLLRGKFEHQIIDFPGVRIVGGTRDRLYNTSNICFEGKSASDLLKSLSDFAVAFGSACTSDKNEPSHVLTAMGLRDEEAKSCIRFSLGKFTTEKEIEFLISTVKKIYSYE